MIVVGLIFMVCLGLLVFGLLLPMGNSVNVSHGVMNPVTLSIAIFCVLVLIGFFALIKRD